MGADREDEPLDPVGAAGRLEDLTDALRPDSARSRVLAELDRMFRTGGAPDPLPEGFVSGKLITTSVWGPLDSIGLRVTRHWMPWHGKSFDRAAMTGQNRFDPSARLAMRVLWPSYRPVAMRWGRLEAFPFRTRVAPGAVDPDVEVLKIDYDFEANPGFLIRRILDEVVQVDAGTYLGKILFRIGPRLRPIGFFSLHRQP